MKNYIFLLLPFLAFSSCEQFDDPIPEGSTLETPILISEIVSPTEVRLTWGSGQSICTGVCPVIAPASFYEIWAKPLTSSVSYKVDAVQAGETTYLMGGLEPGAAQQFYVIAKRANVRNESNRVMVVPNELPTMETIFQKEGFDYITHPEVSPDGTQVVYALSEAGAAGSSQDVFLYDLIGKSERLLRENGQYPSWSASGEKLVFISETANASVINEFTLASGATKTVMSDSYNSYFPQYVGDDKSLVYFLDSLDEGESGFLSLVLAKPDTTFLQAVEYSENVPVPVLGMDYSNELNTLVYSGAVSKDTQTGFSYDIVGFDLENPETTISWVASDWNDTNPSFATADSDLLAFVSDRSGMAQVWIKNTTTPTQQLIQVTDLQDGERIIVGVAGLSWSGQNLFVNIADVQGTTTLVSIDLSKLLGD